MIETGSGATRRKLLQAVAATGLIGTGARATPRHAAFDAVLDGMIRDHGFQGVVAHGRRGRISAVRAVGMAQIAQAEPMRPETPLGIASISKRLTSVAVLRLVDEGRLALDAPITRWLPDYPADTGAQLTLRRLMSNSSGVPNPFRTVVAAEPGLLQPPYITTSDAVRRFTTGELAFTPGGRFDYALSNWILILAIVEAVTGSSYPDAMQKLVLDPLAMSRTTLQASPAVTSYRTVSPPVEWSNPRPPFLAAAGGYFSTAADLIRFAHGVYDTDFLSGPSRQALTTVEIPSENYALGGRVRSLALGGADVRIAWETGNTNGYRSVLAHRLDGEGAVVILCNNAISQRTMDVFAEAVFGSVTQGA